MDITPEGQYQICFFPLWRDSRALGQGLLLIEDSRSHWDTPQSVLLLWTSDQPRRTDKIQHSQQTGIHAHSRYYSSGRVISLIQRQNTALTTERNPCPQSVLLLWTSDQPDSEKKHSTHNRQTPMPPAGFEPAAPTKERPQTHDLARPSGSDLRYEQ
jgi:hypothetical protein